MPRVVIVALNASFSHTSLSIRYLRAAVHDLPLQIITKEYTINEPLVRIADELSLLEPDLLALSCYIWNIEMALKLVERVKLARPSLLTLLGGPQVIDCDQEWMQSHPGVDLVLTGKGERGFRFLCQVLAGDGNLGEVGGLWWRSPSGDIRYNYVNIKEPPLLVRPYWEREEDFTHRLVYYETSRGCPYQCAYCLSAIDRQVIYLPLEQVKEDLRMLAASGTQTVKLVDRTFNLNEKRAMEILDFWVDLPGDCCLHCEMVPDIISPRFLDFLLSLPRGRIQLEFGVQSTNPRALAAVNRRLDWERTREVITRLQEAGNIHLHLDLLVGLPTEDLASFRRSFNDVYVLRPDYLQVGFLKVLPGTPMKCLAEELGYRYTTYPPHEVVKTPWLDGPEMIKLHQLALVVDKLYNDRPLRTGLNILSQLYQGDHFRLWTQLADCASEEQMLGRNQKWENWLYLPVKLAGRQFGERVAAEVEDGLRFDLLSREKRYRLPEPFSDSALPDAQWSGLAPQITRYWPELDGMNLKELKKRVVIHRFTQLPGKKEPHWVAFYYKNGDNPCTDYHEVTPGR